MAAPESTRPITLHVTNMDTASLAHLMQERVTVLDLEIDRAVALKLLQHLRARLDENLPGAIRVRLTGRLEL